MKYEITQELLNITLQVIASSKATGLSYLEIDKLIKELQKLPKIEEEKVSTESKEEEKK